jgi:iron complex outermembrane recepter protein
MSQATIFNQQLNPKTTRAAPLPLMPLTFPVLFVLLGLISGLPCAKAADGQRFSIPAQSLNNALMEFAANSKLEVVFNADMVRGYTTAPVNGSMTSQQALGQLLNGTGITYRYLDAHTVTLTKPATKRLPAAEPAKATRPLPESSDTTLPKVTVEADAEYDAEYYTDPYNKDYVIPNATAGTKTDTPIMETPLNVQVISKQVLKDRQVFRLADALKNVSGVTTTSSNVNFGVFGGTGQNIYLRGFGSQFFMRNGFRLQDGAASRELANVESVEVLKGPAAILYGLVEPGGMVNVTTKQPLATPYYGFTQQFGSYDTYRTTFDATGPLTQAKDLLYRVNLSYENSASFKENVDREDVFFAPTLKWLISPQTQVTFELEYNRLHQGMESGFVPVIPGRQLNIPFGRSYDEYSPGITETIFGSFNWSHQFNDDWAIKHSLMVNHNSFRTDSSTRATGAGDKTFMLDFLKPLAPDADTLKLYGFSSIPENLYVVREFSYNRTNTNTYSTNLDVTGHFNTGFLKHTLLMGGEYYNRYQNETSGISSIEPNFSLIGLNHPVHPGTPVRPPDTFSDAPRDFDQFGLYIQDQIKLPYDLHVTGGIRWQYFYSNDSRDVAANTQDAVTPRVGILWHPENWVSLYANYAESFGANLGLTYVSPGVGKGIDATNAEQYEGGLKFELFDKKLRANLTYFDLTKTNVAVGDPNPRHNCGAQAPEPGSPSDCVISLGKVRSRGPEIDIQGEILPGWNLIATWTNLDIRAVETNANGDTIAGVSPGGRMPSLSRNTGSFWSTYEIQGGDFKGLTFGGGVNLTDSKLSSNEYNASINVPGYITADLMAGYTRKFGDATVSLQFNVNNLLDKRYYSNRVNNNDFGFAFVDFGQPRTFTGQVIVQY